MVYIKVFFLKKQQHSALGIALETNSTLENSLKVSSDALLHLTMKAKDEILGGELSAVYSV